MGDAKQMAQTSLGANAGGSILGAFGALSSGIANSNMYSYQSGIAKLNQQIDLQNAEFAVQTGEQRALGAGLKQAQQMGQIKASQASSGFDVNTGSGKQVQTSQAKLNRLDTDIIRSDAAKTAYGYKEAATVAGAQSTAYQSASSQSLIAGGIGAASSILGGVGSVASMWTQGQRVGLFGMSGNSGASGSGGIGSDYVASGGMGS